MKTYVLDTNILLRFLLRDIEDQYQKAKTLFEKGSKNKIKLIIPQIVIFEVEFALRRFYEFKKEDVIDRMESLISASYLRVEAREIFLEGLDVYQTKNISFVDCFLKSYATIKDAKLVSFDKKIQ